MNDQAAGNHEKEYETARRDIMRIISQGGVLEQTQHEKSNDKTDGGTVNVRRFFRTHGPAIGLIMLIGYVILLGIGVIAEVFNIQWVLDWWIWSPPGKFR